MADYSRYLWLFFLSLIPSISFGQSIPATSSNVLSTVYYRTDNTTYWPTQFIGPYSQTAQEFCVSAVAIIPGATYTGTRVGGNGNPTCDFFHNGYNRSANGERRYGCPGTQITTTWTSQNWCVGALTCPSGYTLNGTMCDPDLPCPMYGTPEGNTAPVDKPSSCNCPADHEWVPMNGCRKKCGMSSYVGNIVGGSSSWPGDSFTFGKGANELCYQGCIIQSAAGEFFEYDDGSRKSKATWTNWACQTSSEPPKPPAEDPPKNPKEPPCGSGEGVLTSSSGKVACIPEGTPAPRKPDVKVREKTESYPDGSEKKTKETKTTDPKTGASHTHSSTTSSGGMAGPAGTTEGTESETGTGTGGDGDGNCEGDDCGDGDYQPGEFPGTEGLYEKKYENGIQGVLDARYAEVQNSQLFSLVGKLIPTNVPNSGTCSPFSISMNIGQGMNFGGGSIEVPCYVWTFIRVVMLISALLLARRLIFGG